MVAGCNACSRVVELVLKSVMGCCFLTLLIGLHFTDKAYSASSDISNDACGLPDPQFPIKTKDEVNQRIWNGHKARAFSFPWAVTLCNPKGFCFCGATIISRDWIVTAAHCLVDIWIMDNPLIELYAYAGVIDRQVTGRTVQKRKFARVEISPHPSHTHNDFGLVKLEQPFKFNEWVKPICIPWEPPPDHTECIFAGWGMTHPGGYKDRIQMVYYKTYNNPGECQRYTNYFQDPSEPNRDPNEAPRLCAGMKKGTVMRYNCPGDDGSGLICKHPEDPGVWFLHGISMYPFACDNLSRVRANYFMTMYNMRDFTEKVTGIKFPALLNFTVSTPDEVYVSLGDDLTLPCSATFEDPSDSVVWMKWINSTKSNAVEVYRYMLPGAQDPVDSAFPTMVPRFNENDRNRYIRQGLNLVIKNFQVKDAGRKCCEIGAGVHARRRRKSSCTDILWTGFPNLTETTSTTTDLVTTTTTAAKPTSTSITPAGSSPTGGQSTKPSSTTGQPTNPTTPTTPATPTPTRPTTPINEVSTSTQSPKGEVPGGTEGQSSRNKKNAILAVGVVSGVAAVVGIVFAVLMALKRKKALEEEKKKALFRSFSLPQAETATV